MQPHQEDAEVEDATEAVADVTDPGTEQTTTGAEHK
jgi:hypothetical protein